MNELKAGNRPKKANRGGKNPQYFGVLTCENPFKVKKSACEGLEDVSEIVDDELDKFDDKYFDKAQSVNANFSSVLKALMSYEVVNPKILNYDFVYRKNVESICIAEVLAQAAVKHFVEKGNPTLLKEMIDRTEGSVTQNIVMDGNFTREEKKEISEDVKLITVQNFLSDDAKNSADFEFRKDDAD